MRAHRLRQGAAAAALGIFWTYGQIHAQSAADLVQDVTDDPNSVDITNAIFTNMMANCADYVDAYASKVTDLQQDRTFNGAVIIKKDKDGCTLSSNGIPNHNFGGGVNRPFAVPAGQIGKSFNITSAPKFASSPQPLVNISFNGVFLNGVPIDIVAAACYSPDSPRANADGIIMIGCRYTHPWLVDPMSPFSPIELDNHHAHTQPESGTGRYHYHGNPEAMFNVTPGPDGSPLIGFAADGFPIYGSYFRDETGTVRKAKSGYTLKSGKRPSGDGNPGGDYNGLYRGDYTFTGQGDLDECNGMTVNGVYAYFVTDEYPWIIACFKGTADASFRKPPPDRRGRPGRPGGMRGPGGMPGAPDGMRPPPGMPGFPPPPPPPPGQ
ncbi:YHYH protein [Roseibium sp. RKSG952]|uniref:YHYH protein n=1 Tax=Roseibium sp. RKSG952 TaxID=2529384 RepID=UPI0018AD215E|nr:YHYH protein [Roseibium sp. RKSG952]